jgi:hypothetical protein
MACVTRVQGQVVVDPHPGLEMGTEPEEVRPPAARVDRAVQSSIRPSS